MTAADPAIIPPSGLITALLAAGFTESSRTARAWTLYARLEWPAGVSRAKLPTLLVPLEQADSAEYAQTIQVVLDTLRQVAAAGVAATDVLATITAAGRP